MSMSPSKQALIRLRQRHATLFDSAIAELEAKQTDPWMQAFEIAQYRVSQLKLLSKECGPSTRQGVSAALSALARANSERQLERSIPSQPAKGQASIAGG
jgi:hypothetical protein